MKHIHLSPKPQQKTLCNCFGANVSGHKGWGNVQSQKDSATPGKNGNTEVGEHQNMNGSPHHQEQICPVNAASAQSRAMLKAVTAVSSGSSISPQQPSSGHGIHRAWDKEQTHPYDPNTAGGFWRGEINQNHQSQKELTQSGLSCGAMEPNPGKF